jgi:hypothetical protein
VFDSAKVMFVHRTYLTAVHRHAGLGQLVALLLLSLFLHSASQLPKGPHWQHTGLEDEKRVQHSSRLSALAS